jgi:hypothetical protein
MKVIAKRKHSALEMLLIAGLLASVPSLSWACCPSDGHTAPRAATGLGQSSPPSVDLAPDPAWAVYELEYKGIRYVQIDDANGIPRAAAGRIGTTFWGLPVGSDPGRLSLPGDAVPAGRQRLLYRGNDVEVILIEGAAQPRWLIRPPSTN